MSSMSILPSLPTMKLCMRGRVLVRVDMNVPFDKSSGRILDEYRIEAHSRTIRKLVEAGLPVVIMTHQGRPGDSEFTSLEKHAETLGKYLGMNVKFVDDVMGPKAREEIRNLKGGEVLLLDNVRFVSEELLEGEPERLAQTYLVRRLAPLFDHFILDAFATAHRSQPSIVGFPCVLPSCMGLVMENEVNALSKILECKGRSALLIAGGSKIPETVNAIKSLLEKGIVSKVLVGGLIGQLFLGVRYKREEWVRESPKVTPETIKAVEYVLSTFSDRVIMPIDVIRCDERIVNVEETPDKLDICSIGPATIDLYVREIEKSNVVIMTGPISKIEDEKFVRGTYEVMKAMTEYAEYSVIGGAHTIMAAKRFGLIDKISHVSTGGRAFLQFLSNPELPGIRALELSKVKFWR